MTINPNMKRLRRPDLPNIYMGPSAGPPVATPAPTASKASDPDKDQQLVSARAQITSLKAELAKQAEQSKLLGDQQVKLQVEASQALRDLDSAKASAESVKAKLSAELQEAKVQLEAALAKVSELESQEPLDSPAPSDKVWVPVIESRTTENGNAVVACMFHFGDESKMVTGTIYIPTSEIGKLKPVGNKDAGR